MVRKGHWLVITDEGKNCKFTLTKEMVAFIRKHPGCVIYWVRNIK